MNDALFGGMVLQEEIKTKQQTKIGIDLIITFIVAFSIIVFEILLTDSHTRNRARGLYSQSILR